MGLASGAQKGSDMKPHDHQAPAASSFGSVSCVSRWPKGAFPIVCMALGVFGACGEDGLAPSTVNPGADFVQEDVVFDDDFYYCRVEKVLFAQSCGGGIAGQDPQNGCHFSVTQFRLTNYVPLAGDSCAGDALAPGAIIPVAAQQNYTAAQARMKRDPKLAPLLQRPLGKAQHPRKIFEENSAEAEVIRQWATQFSNQ